MSCLLEHRRGEGLHAVRSTLLTRATTLLRKSSANTPRRPTRLCPNMLQPTGHHGTNASAALHFECALPSSSSSCLNYTPHPPGNQACSSQATTGASEGDGRHRGSLTPACLLADADVAPGLSVIYITLSHANSRPLSEASVSLKSQQRGQQVIRQMQRHMRKHAHIRKSCWGGLSRCCRAATGAAARP